MQNFLDKIKLTKHREIAENKKEFPESDLKEMVKDAQPVRNFYKSLKDKIDSGKFALIAELKRASPSKKVIRKKFDPESLARAYESGGATCLSVLTEQQHFKGSSEFLMKARDATNLPVLCKDFMYEPYQVYLARYWNADCILIILAAVDDSSARLIEETALKLGMSVLLEIRDEHELERANRMHSDLVGINNRDLNSLKTDLKTSVELATQLFDSNKLIVGESGIKTNKDLLRLSESNINAFLVGESLMSESDVENATRMLLTTKDREKRVILPNDHNCSAIPLFA